MHVLRKNGSYPTAFQVVIIFLRNYQKISLFPPLKGGEISSLRVIEIAFG